MWVAWSSTLSIFYLKWKLSNLGQKQKHFRSFFYFPTKFLSKILENDFNMLKERTPPNYKSSKPNDPQEGHVLSQLEIFSLLICLSMSNKLQKYFGKKPWKIKIQILIQYAINMQSKFVLFHPMPFCKYEHKVYTHNSWVFVFFFFLKK